MQPRDYWKQHRFVRESEFEALIADCKARCTQPLLRSALVVGHGDIECDQLRTAARRADQVLCTHEPPSVSLYHPCVDVVSCDWDIRHATVGRDYCQEQRALDDGYHIFYGIAFEDYANQEMLYEQFRISKEQRNAVTFFLLERKPWNIAVMRRSGFWGAFFARRFLLCDRVKHAGVSVDNIDYLKFWSLLDVSQWVFDDAAFAKSPLICPNFLETDAGMWFDTDNFEVLMIKPNTSSLDDTRQYFFRPSCGLSRYDDYADCSGIDERCLYKRVLVLGHGTIEQPYRDTSEFDFVISTHEPLHPDTNLIVSCDWDARFKQDGRDYCQEERALDDGYVVLYYGSRRFINDKYKSHPNLKFVNNIHHPGHLRACEYSGLFALYVAKYLLRATVIETDGLTCTKEYYKNAPDLVEYHRQLCQPKVVRP